MVWVIVVVAMVVMGLAAIAGTGRLGEMPHPVSDRPKPHFPERPFDERYLAELRLPTLLNGYARDQVDEALAACATGAAEVATLVRMRFDVVRGGYAMDAVDELIDRLTRADEAARAEAQDAVDDPFSPEDLKVRDNRGVRTTEEIEDAHGSDEAPHW